LILPKKQVGNKKEPARADLDVTPLDLSPRYHVPRAQPLAGNGVAVAENSSKLDMARRCIKRIEACNRFRGSQRKLFRPKAAASPTMSY